MQKNKQSLFSMRIWAHLYGPNILGSREGKQLYSVVYPTHVCQPTNLSFFLKETCPLFYINDNLSDFFHHILLLSKMVTGRMDKWSLRQLVTEAGSANHVQILSTVLQQQISAAW